MFRKSSFRIKGRTLAILKEICLDFPQIFPYKCWASTSSKPYPFPSNLKLNNLLATILPLPCVYSPWCRKISIKINCVLMTQTVWNGTPEWLGRNDLDRVWKEHAAACRETVKGLFRTAGSCSYPQSGEPVDRPKLEQGTFRIQDRRGNFRIQDRRGNFPNTRQKRELPNTRQTRELSEYEREEGTFRLQDRRGNFPITRQKRELSD